MSADKHASLAKTSQARLRRINSFLRKLREPTWRCWGARMLPGSRLRFSRHSDATSGSSTRPRPWPTGCSGAGPSSAAVGSRQRVFHRKALTPAALARSCSASPGGTRPRWTGPCPKHGPRDQRRSPCTRATQPQSPAGERRNSCTVGNAVSADARRDRLSPAWVRTTMRYSKTVPSASSR